MMIMMVKMMRMYKELGQRAPPVKVIQEYKYWTGPKEPWLQFLITNNWGKNSVKTLSRVAGDYGVGASRRSNPICVIEYPLWCEPRDDWISMKWTAQCTHDEDDDWSMKFYITVKSMATCGPNKVKIPEYMATVYWNPPNIFQSVLFIYNILYQYHCLFKLYNIQYIVC